VRSFDTALRAARERDIAFVRMRVHEQRRVQAALQHELTAIQREILRRSDPTPDQRDLEQPIRAEHATSRRVDNRQPTGGTGQRGPSQPYQPPRYPPSSELRRGFGLSR
jgi:hypothetical protein